jgi:uncharacterized membrane protein YfcA
LNVQRQLVAAVKCEPVEASYGRLPSGQRGAIVRHALIALPATIAGAWSGSFAYRRLADRGYQRAVMVLLLISGIALLWTSR